MYGLIALGFHVTYVVSNTVNFSQGSSVMLGAVLGYTFAVRLGWPMPLAFAAALLLCAAFGLLVERALVRPVRGARLERLADGHGGRRHRASTTRCCLRSARSRAAFRPLLSDQAHRDLRHRRLSTAARHSDGRRLGVAVAFSLFAAPHAPRQGACWRWCRMRTRRA